jgi:transposase InsO family protein
MSERLDFIQACLDRTEHIVRICDRFGISEKTGQKWLKRFKQGGFAALEDRSHAPKNHNGRITPEVRERLVALRKKYPLYGPETLRAWLDLHEPRENGLKWPAPSSIGDLLSREGLVRKKRRRNLPVESAQGEESRERSNALAPNDVWTADFKGEFRLDRGLGQYCYPLTVLDLKTHYLFACRALSSVAIDPAKAVFEELFREYGLPKVMRTDNGLPFAQPNAFGKLGKLSYWWVRLGIRPEHIRPGKPQDNGAHERFHRTLKAAATIPSKKNLQAQQKRFDSYIHEYNVERPHASLERRPPAQLYERSPRAYPEKLPAIIYPEDSEVRLIDSGGSFKWKSENHFLTKSLSGQYIGLVENAADLVVISFGALELGVLDLELNRFTPRLRWHGPA